MGNNDQDLDRRGSLRAFLFIGIISLFPWYFMFYMTLFCSQTLVNSNIFIAILILFLSYPISLTTFFFLKIFKINFKWIKKILFTEYGLLSLVTIVQVGKQILK